MEKLDRGTLSSLTGGEASAAECFVWGLGIGMSVADGNPGTTTLAVAGAMSRGCFY
jgi:hypothetical protein